MSPDHIRTVLDKVLQKLNLNEKQDQCKVYELWEEGVGPKISGHTSPYSLTTQGKLLVNVDSSVWVEELTKFHKEKIKKSLNALLGKDVIKDIFFRVGKT